MSTADLDELDDTGRHSNGNVYRADRETDRAPPMDAEAMLRDVVIPKLERLDREMELHRDREQRLVQMVMEIHAEMFRDKKEA